MFNWTASIRSKLLMILQTGILLLSLELPTASASPEMERAYLLQLVHQIDAMQTTILAAEKEQSPEARTQFHYRAYRVNGKSQNGVIEDLALIKVGIKEKLNSTVLEPRNIQPINGDYLISSAGKEK